MAKLALLLSALFMAPLAAHAHSLDLALVNLSGEGGRVHVSVGVHPAIAGKMDQRELFSGITLSKNGVPCVWQGAPIVEEVNPQILNFENDARCASAEGGLSLALPFLASQAESYRAIYQAKIDGNESVGDAIPARPVIELESAGGFSFRRFVGMGLEHIAEGTDHILFVLALLLAGGSLLSVLKTVSGFTVGHSLTLALGAFGLVRLPSELVEPAIALSIVIVAVESLMAKGEGSRWKLATAFGLIHGLGFASALTELGLQPKAMAGALLGFNIGVELAQAAIVTAAFPLLLLLQRFQPTRRYAIPAFSLVILAAGTFWFAERAIAAF